MGRRRGLGVWGGGILGRRRWGRWSRGRGRGGGACGARARGKKGRGKRKKEEEEELQKIEKHIQIIDKDGEIKSIGENIIVVCRYLHTETGTMCYTQYNLNEVFVDDVH